MSDVGGATVLTPPTATTSPKGPPFRTGLAQMAAHCARWSESCLTVDSDGKRWAGVTIDRMLALPGIGAKD